MDAMNNPQKSISGDTLPIPSLNLSSLRWEIACISQYALLCKGYPSKLYGMLGRHVKHWGCRIEVHISFRHFIVLRNEPTQVTQVMPPFPPPPKADLHPASGWPVTTDLPHRRVTHPTNVNFITLEGSDKEKYIYIDAPFSGSALEYSTWLISEN